MEKINKFNEKEFQRYLELKNIENTIKNSLYKIIWELEIAEWDKMFYVEIIKYEKSWTIMQSLKTVKFKSIF